MVVRTGVGRTDHCHRCVSLCKLNGNIGRGQTVRRRGKQHRLGDLLIGNRRAQKPGLHHLVDVMKESMGNKYAATQLTQSSNADKEASETDMSFFWMPGTI